MLPLKETAVKAFTVVEQNLVFVDSVAPKFATWKVNETWKVKSKYLSWDIAFKII